jgi:hypothetical protein
MDATHGKPSEEQLLRPSPEDVSAILEKLDRLKRQVKRLEGPFLTEIEQGALAAAEKGNIHEYCSGLARSNERYALLKTIYGPSNIPGFTFGEYKGGCFAYSNESAKVGLTKKNQERQAEFHSDQITPLQDEILVDIHPFRAYFAMNASWNIIETLNIEASLRSTDPVHIENIILEFRKLHRQAEVEERVAQGPQRDGDHVEKPDLQVGRRQAEKTDQKPNGPGQPGGTPPLAGNAKPTPKTDTTLIYQADGAEFYNIPKSTLSKAAGKKPGEPGYLWSDTDGERRWYRKSDLQKISRSREKLRGV